MIIAAESNFVLELTFRQNEARECERLLELADNRTISLAIPACSLFEPYETLIRRRKQREEILRRLRDELRDLARSEAYGHLEEASKSLTRVLAESGEVQASTLDKTIDKILRVATIIPLSAEVMRHTLAVQLAYPLAPQDAVVFASVDLYMREQGKGPKYFANKNRRDFMTPEVERHFEQYECRILHSFAATRRLTEKEDTVSRHI